MANTVCVGAWVAPSVRRLLLSRKAERSAERRRAICASATLGKRPSARYRCRYLWAPASATDGPGPQMRQLAEPHADSPGRRLLLTIPFRKISLSGTVNTPRNALKLLRPWA